MHDNETSHRIRNLIISLATFAALVLYASTYSVPVLRVSVMPEESSLVLRHKHKPLIDYLEKRIGMKIEYRPSHDGDTLVDALLNNKLDMVWIDGFYFVRAQARSNDQVIPLVQRAEDEKTQSVFLTAQKNISRLEDLKGRRFSFGAETSASGYLMPRSFLMAAHIDPDTDVKSIFSGSPEETIVAVTSGKADAGVMSNLSWQKLIEQGKADPKALHVFYASPIYHDYNWAVRADMDVNLRQKLADAFLALDKNIGLDKEILDLQRASKFIPTQAESYSEIEAAARRAGQIP